MPSGIQIGGAIQISSSYGMLHACEILKEPVVRGNEHKVHLCLFTNLGYIFQNIYVDFF